MTTHYLLDGGNVIGEVTGDATTTYLRGVNLISSSGTYYLYNAHGDVVQLTNANGELTRNYNYDAFGNERDPDEDDSNPFRYCGEYYDTETGLYYLRARYYDPLIGRFTQEDTHWNTVNMIYGDNPQKINEREDKLGLKHYSYAPQISAIIQSGNLYVYAAGNPILYADPTGNSFILSCILVGIIAGLFVGGAIGHEIATYNGYDGTDGWDYWQYVTWCGLAGGVIGGLAGWGIGSLATASVAATTSAGSAGATELYSSWQQAEEGTRLRVGNNATYAERIFQTPDGNRIVDAYNSTIGKIAEAKYGYVTATEFIRKQVAKDAFLLREGIVDVVEWHFYISQQTGLGGASQTLLKMLFDAGIKVIFHCG